MKTVSLLEFVKTGSFGGATLGMDDKEVLQLLGEPDGEDDYEEVLMFSYGWWEVHFLKDNSNKAFLIHNKQLLYDCENHDEMLRFENEKFRLNTDFVQPFKYARVRQILDLMDKEGIGFSIVNEEREPIMKFDSGVYMNFTDVEPVIPKPDGFHFGPSRGQRMIDGDKKIEHSDDLILYTIGISNLHEVIAKQRLAN